MVVDRSYKGGKGGERDSNWGPKQECALDLSDSNSESWEKKEKRNTRNLQNSLKKIKET